MYSTRYLKICCVKTVIYYEQIYNIYLLLLLIRMSKAKTTEGLRAPPALSPRQHQPLIPCDASCSFVSPSPPLAPSINCPAAVLWRGGGNRRN